MHMDYNSECSAAAASALLPPKTRASLKLSSVYETSQDQRVRSRCRVITAPDCSKEEEKVGVHEEFSSSDDEGFEASPNFWGVDEDDDSVPQPIDDIR